MAAKSANLCCCPGKSVSPAEPNWPFVKNRRPLFQISDTSMYLQNPTTIFDLTLHRIKNDKRLPWTRNLSCEGCKSLMRCILAGPFVAVHRWDACFQLLLSEHPRTRAQKPATQCSLPRHVEKHCWEYENPHLWSLKKLNLHQLLSSHLCVSCCSGTAFDCRLIKYPKTIKMIEHLGSYQKKADNWLFGLLCSKITY